MLRERRVRLGGSTTASLIFQPLHVVHVKVHYRVYQGYHYSRTSVRSPQAPDGLHYRSVHHGSLSRVLLDLNEYVPCHVAR